MDIQNVDIFFSQIIIESGNFKSNICKSNNNLDGMKFPGKRKTYAVSKRFGYAVYKTWIHSVADYKLWQLSNKQKKKNEKYGHYLNRIGYCESKTYGQMLEKKAKQIFKNYYNFYYINKKLYDARRS